MQKTIAKCKDLMRMNVYTAMKALIQSRERIQGYLAANSVHPTFSHEWLHLPEFRPGGGCIYNIYMHKCT